MPVVSRRINIPSTQPSTPVNAAPVAPSRGRVTEKMRKDARAFFAQNREMNRLASGSKKIRAELLKSMEASAISAFEVVLVEPNSSTTQLVVEVATPIGTEIDPSVLYKTMDCAKDPKQLKAFLAIVSASKKAVVDALGTAVATRCERPAEGNRNVSVTVKKD